jgi:hypothetical protein
MKVHTLILGILVLTSCSNSQNQRIERSVDKNGITSEFIDGKLISKVKYIDNKEEGVKIDYSNSDNHTIYTFWKNGIQSFHVFELDSIGRIVTDTTTISASINLPVSCLNNNETTVFYAKINNPQLKLLHAYCYSNFDEYDSTFKDSHDWMTNDKIVTVKYRFSQEGSCRVSLRLLAEYKNVIKYYSVIYTVKVLSENEYKKYLENPKEYRLGESVGYDIVKY